MSDQSPLQTIDEDDDGRAEAALDLALSADLFVATNWDDVRRMTPQVSEFDPYGFGQALDLLDEQAARRRTNRRQRLVVRIRRYVAGALMDWADRVHSFASYRIWK